MQTCMLTLVHHRQRHLISVGHIKMATMKAAALQIRKQALGMLI